MAPANLNTQRCGIDMNRLYGMADPLITCFIDIELGTKGQGTDIIFGALINQRALQAIKGGTIGVRFNEILIDFGADFFEQIAHMTEDGKIAPNGMFALKGIT